METLNQLLLQHNALGNATLTVKFSDQEENAIDLYRNGKVLACGLTYDKAVAIVSALVGARRQDIAEKVLELKALLAAIQDNDDCCFGEDIESEITGWTAILNN